MTIGWLHAPSLQSTAANVDSVAKPAGLRPSGESPRDPLMVCIPTVEYNRLLRISRQYSSLYANLVQGGTDDATIALLSETQPHQGNDSLEQEHHFETSSRQASDSSPQKPADDYTNRLDEWVVSQPDSVDGYPTRQPSHGSYFSTSSRTDGHPTNSWRHASREGTRTIALSNLAEGTTHLEVANMIRGGQVLDIYLRYRDRSAAVSFLHENDAKAFINHVKRHDLYIKQKRVDVSWNNRQFTLSDHIARKVASGATRNLVIRKCNPNHSVQSIRDDLEHIHNLVVLKIDFIRGDCYISTNSVTAATFARTCMMSRLKYKGSRVEYDTDECCQSLDRLPLRTPNRTKLPFMMKEDRISTVNRFKLLSINNGGD